jgi:hypothetical protein
MIGLHIDRLTLVTVIVMATVILLVIGALVSIWI